MSSIASVDLRRFRVGFDVDGVLADLVLALSRHAAALFGEVAASPEVRLTARRRQRLWNRVRAVEDFWETLEEIEAGGVARLAAVARERQWETIFLTTRPETAGNPAQTQTQRWLAARGIAYPSVFVVRGSRGAIASALALDAMVDDRAQNCVDVVSESSARALLLWRPTADVPDIALNRPRIDVVKSLDESLDLLTEIDCQRQRPHSHFARFLHAFARRPAAPVA
jgi:hypothetical protein